MSFFTFLSSLDLSGQVLHPFFNRTIHYLFSFCWLTAAHIFTLELCTLSLQIYFYLLLQLEMQKASLPAHQEDFSKETQTTQQVSGESNKHLTFIFINTLHMISLTICKCYLDGISFKNKNLLLPCQLWEAELNPVCARCRVQMEILRPRDTNIKLLKSLKHICRSILNIVCFCLWRLIYCFTPWLFFFHSLPLSSASTHVHTAVT